MWGPDLGCLKEKTVHSQPIMAVQVPQCHVLRQIMQQYRHITISVDVMKVNSIPFFMTISKHIKFGSAGKLYTMDDKMILRHFKGILGLYAIRGFKVTIIMADNQFESMRGDMQIWEHF